MWTRALSFSVLLCLLIPSFSLKIPRSKWRGMQKLRMSKDKFETVEKLHYGWYVRAINALMGAMAKDLYKVMNRKDRKALVACLDAIEGEEDMQSGAKCLTKAFDGQLHEYAYAYDDPKYDFVGRSDKKAKKNRRNQSIRVRPSDDVQYASEESRERKRNREMQKEQEIGREENGGFLKVGRTEDVSTPPEFIPSIKPIHRKLNIQKISEKKKKSMSKKKKVKKIKKIRKIKKVNIVKETKPMRILTARQFRMEKLRKKHRQITDNFRIRRRRVKRYSFHSNPEAAAYEKEMDRKDQNPYDVKTMDKMPELKSQLPSPVRKMTKLIRTFLNHGGEGNGTKMETSYKRLEELQDLLEKRRDRQKFKHRMLDTVIGTEHPLKLRRSFSEQFKDLMPEETLPVPIYGLLDSIAKHNHQKVPSGRILSPRFVPIVPEDKDRPGFISPNLFPLYKDDSPNSILPIPTLLEKAGIAKGDRDEILQLVMDASGTNDIVSDAMDILNQAEHANLDTDIMGVTKAMKSVFKFLESSLDPKQKDDMNNKLFTFMHPDQIRNVFAAGGVTNVSNMPFDVDEYAKLSDEERMEGLRDRIRHIANGGKDVDQMYESAHHRSKRTIKVVYFQHVTLAPFAFSPGIMTLSVLGPVTLSPSIFSPGIIAPLLLSPPVISPQVGNPLILSPYVLGPNVLSAAVFNAYVLSPYVLSPNVINPYVMSPLILSPFVLCPDILSPTVLSGAVLSPSVASPGLGSPSVLAAAVLSPSFLS